MAGSSYIKLVPNSRQQDISLEDLKELFHYYKEITGKTGKQLGWGYENAAFPYEIKQQTDSNGQWFYLKGTEDRYAYILIGVGKEKHDEGSFQSYIQVTLPDESTYGDKGKANEFSKFLAKKLEGELHLFNGRIMYYYKRK
ncbi:DUF1885 family protein [Bacillus solimangrovi]|uniref:DUF1885 domain-containing protein n=1 Tax=Bacillus solimangrovi TaxID=1305675 RepID=A0A1E5LII3_9BACI|nr:DUF1885 family protein [Bacillus solimangrovi]OEH93892.1 hypothetical protein BFG57_10490 [Bacillus solimangrovi]